MTINVTSGHVSTDYTAPASTPAGNTNTAAALPAGSGSIMPVSDNDKRSAIAKMLRERAPQNTKLNIANRDDAMGGGRDWDHKTMQALSGRETVAIAAPEQQAQETAFHASYAAIKNKPQRPFQWSHENNVNYPVARPSVRADGKSEEGLLVIPGGPVSLPTEVKGTPGMPGAPTEAFLRYPPKLGREDSATTRLSLQAQLIKDARNLGQPVLAICGGSWHVARAFGGNTVTSTEFEQDHTADMPSIVPIRGQNGAPPAMGVAHGHIMQHPIDVEQGSLLASTLNRDGDAQTINVNSVHWSEVLSTDVTRQDGTVERAIAGQDQMSSRPTSELLKVTARIHTEDEKKATIEGYESRHGAPIMAVQYHPEALAGVPVAHPNGEAPTSTFNPENYETERAASAALFDYMSNAGDAYAARRNMTREFQARVDDGTLKTGENTFPTSSTLFTERGLTPPAAAIPHVNKE